MNGELYSGGWGWLVLLAGMVGVVVGLGAAFAFVHSERVLRRAEPAVEPELDDGIAQVLSVLGSAAAVVRRDHSVVRATPAAYALGLVRGDRLAHGRVRKLVTRVTMDATIEEDELELPRAASGSGTVTVRLRVASLSHDLVLILADDRTEARRVEQVRRDFTANVSHELKTPVGAIALLTETIEDAATDPQMVRKFAASARQEAKRLELLVQDILELSKLESDSATVTIRPVSIDASIAGARFDCETLAASRGVVVCEPAPTGLEVFGDGDLLRTAIRNLIANAIRYSPAGTQVRVVTNGGKRFVRVQVIDQGIGIAPEHQDRIFERFFRADPARARDTGGTGLGLSIVKHVAHSLGGEVSVWSRPGQGSTFTLSIPRAHHSANALEESA